MKPTTQKIHQELLVLVRQERKILANIISHLQEVSDKKFFFEFNRQSLLDYCIKDLGHSESAAIRRIKALKLVRQNPEVKSAIEKGELTLSQAATAQSLFERHSQENRSALAMEFKTGLLEQIKGKSSLDSENIIREKLQLPKKSQTIRIEANKDVFNSWIKFKGTMMHKNWSDEKLLKYLLELAEEKRLQKFDGNQAKATIQRSGSALAMNKPSTKTKTSKNQRYVSSETKRAIYARSGGKCEHPKCDSTYALELDHIRPISQNGQSTIQNLQVLCRQHNQLKPSSRPKRSSSP